MKIVALSSRCGKPLALDVNNWILALLSVCALGVPASAYVAGRQLSGEVPAGAVAALEAQLARQRAELIEGRADAGRQVQALTRKLAEMQARLVRLDALGERVVQLAGLDGGEFNFGSVPPTGGPPARGAGAAGAGAGAIDLDQLLAGLETRIGDREQQLAMLTTLIADRTLKQDLTMDGWPVAKGWIASRYGVRVDPFTGRRAHHEGLDFVGRPGAAVIAVAAGVVVRSGAERGYGQTVDIAHADGLVTRYAHNQQNLVAVGDTVAKGQVIARLGSTGRSTGPHVHFEVYKNGRVIDPASYIQTSLH